MKIVLLNVAAWIVIFICWAVSIQSNEVENPTHAQKQIVRMIYEDYPLIFNSEAEADIKSEKDFNKIMRRLEMWIVEHKKECN